MRTPNLYSSLDPRSQQDHLKIFAEIVQLRYKISIVFGTKMLNDFYANVKMELFGPASLSIPSLHNISVPDAQSLPVKGESHWQLDSSFDTLMHSP